MKPFLLSSFNIFSTNYLSRIIVLILIALNVSVTSSSQCAAGYTRDTINWDYLDFLHQSGSTYSGSYSGTFFMTAAMAQTQYFGVSGNRITYTNTNSCPIGRDGTTAFYADITTHTGETGSFGVAEDVKFMPAVGSTYSMTFAFQTVVKDIKFSIHDIDRSQRIAVTALNGAAAKNITMATLGTTILTLNNNNTATANAKAGDFARGVTSLDGSINVTITDSVTSFTITVSETVTTGGSAANTEDGGFYLSDISACFANPSFPTNYYYSYTEPYTNQPAYFIANPQSMSVYMVQATGSTIGTAELIFTDPGTTEGEKMNSLAYDPVNHWLYYVMDNYSLYPVNPPQNRRLKKYDFTTGTISTVIADLRTFGIPTFIQGVEFAGASFYNGSLYLGLEGSDGTSNGTGAESIVWKIDFNGSGTPTTHTQVFALPGDNGAGLRRHDWGDMVIKDGILISHATYESPASTNIYTHYNMQTGTATTYTGEASTAGQLGQIYNGNIYRIKNNIALYNGTGGIGATIAITTTSCSPAWVGNAGDGSDPFRPMQDFGDAPASYDPVAVSVAANQKSCNNATLRIGSAWGDEWVKNTLTTDASGDDEEDGIGTVSIMVSDGVAYNHVQDVVVLNNTGANAYLGGWLDYDADGVFEAGEAVVVTVPSSASPQTISLGWTGITVAIGTPNSFLRVRLTSSALAAGNATGWFIDGETEDYPVISQAAPLTIKLLDFNATLTRDKNVLLNWKAYADNEAAGFEVERSTDQNGWEKIGTVNLNTSAFTADYSLLDQQPVTGKSYYRLKMIEKSGSSRYSNTRLIQIDNLITNLKIYPNPVKNDVTVSFNSVVDQTATLYVRSMAGEVMIKKSMGLSHGDNRISFKTDGLSNGLYIVELVTPGRSFINKLTVSH